MSERDSCAAVGGLYWFVPSGCGDWLVYVYARETRDQADIAKVLTFDEARRIAVNVAKPPGLSEFLKSEGA